MSALGINLKTAFEATLTVDEDGDFVEMCTFHKLMPHGGEFSAYLTPLQAISLAQALLLNAQVLLSKKEDNV